jgi:hypothetical protein
MVEDLIDKAKKMVTKMKGGHVYRIDLKAIKLIEEMIKELKKHQDKRKADANTDDKKNF